MKRLAFIGVIFLCSGIFAQNTEIKYYYPDNGIKAITLDEVESIKYLENAYASFNDNNLVLTKQYLDKSENNGVRSASFYYLLGLYAYRISNFDAAQRYWHRGFSNYGCEECEELKIATKNRQSIEPIILKQQAKWEKENE